MYGGNEVKHEFAMKAAGKELLSRDWFQSGSFGEVNLPLMCLIDFKGYRLT